MPFVVSLGERATRDDGAAALSKQVQGMTMNVVSFCEIAHGKPLHNYVRVGTGTVEEVRSMQRPPCYLCLHGSLDTDQLTAWAQLGRAVLDEASNTFKDVDQEGLERYGAPLSLVLKTTSLIKGALPVVRAFTDDVRPTDSERWFAIDVAHDHVTPVTEQEAWDGLACAGSAEWWERMSYISVKGPQDDLHLVFDRIVTSFEEDLRQARMDAEMS
jgi:hypothetical protein